MILVLAMILGCVPPFAVADELEKSSKDSGTSTIEPHPNAIDSPKIAKELTETALRFLSGIDKDAKAKVKGQLLFQDADGNEVLEHHIHDMEFVDGKIKKINVYSRAKTME